MPGGQPSTMQPMAGPWLSPKVVTVKSLPMELPDMLRLAAGVDTHDYGSPLGAIHMGTARPLGRCGWSFSGVRRKKTPPPPFEVTPTDRKRRDAPRSTAFR